VAERAELVRIDSGRLEELVGGLELRNPDPVPADFAITLNAINFGSGWHPHLRKLPGMSGSRTIMSRLQERFDTEGPLTPDELAQVTPDDCAELLAQRMEPPVGELMALFARSLNDLGRFLIDDHDGSFEALVQAADRSAVKFVELLQAMPMYRDVATYGGRPVPFLKRAQITASDIGTFDDLDCLTIFPDNLVPHVLRLEGVLVVDAAVVAAIERDELLQPGGHAEIELRATAVHAVERLTQLSGTPPRQLDYTLWDRGQHARYKAVPRPRIRTYFY
jgi:hypothetical protein